jgi:hypothetical protein
MKKEDMAEKQKQAEQIAQWISSEEGRLEICAILREVERVTSQLSHARRVDQDDLEKPITM